MTKAQAQKKESALAMSWSLILLVLSTMTIGATLAQAAGLQCEAVFSGAHDWAGPIAPVVHRDKAAVDRLGLGWLRDLNSPEVKAFVERENAKSKAFVQLKADGSPNEFHKIIKDRLTQLKPNNRPVAFTFSGGELVIKDGGLTMKKLTGEETVLAARIAHPGNEGATSVSEFLLSPDQKKVAYAYVKNGGDVCDWYVLNLENSAVMSGPMTSQFNGGLTWTADSKGVFYTKWATPDQISRGILYSRNMYRDLSFNHMVSRDVLAFRPQFGGARDFYAINEFVDSKGETIRVAARMQGSAEIPLTVYMGRKRPADPAKGEYVSGGFAWAPVRIANKQVLGKFVTFDGRNLILRSTEIGGNFGLVAVDTHDGMKARVLVPENPGEVLLNAQRAGDKILTQYLDKNSFATVAKVLDLQGHILKSLSMKDFGLPEIGGLSGFTATLDSTHADFTYSTIATPPETFRLDLQTLDLQKSQRIAQIDFDPTKVSLRRERVLSLDGVTEVPIELYTRADGQKPTFIYQYYYGYIGTATFPSWTSKLQAVLEMGGAVLITHIRGGGELGRDWQIAVKDNRMPSVEDSVAAVRWARRTLGVDRTVAWGRSYGGLHSNMLAVFFPRDYDIINPTVPVSDLNEFLNNSGNSHFGRFAADDFGIERNSRGELLDTAEFRDRLSRFSPLQNIQQMQALPWMMSFTADGDQRVNSQQTYYMTEALNRQFPGNTRVFMNQDTNQGHSGRTEGNDELAFIGRIFGITQLSPLSPLSPILPN